MLRVAGSARSGDTAESGQACLTDVLTCFLKSCQTTVASMFAPSCSVFLSLTQFNSLRAAVENLSRFFQNQYFPVFVEGGKQCKGWRYR